MTFQITFQRIIKTTLWLLNNHSSNTLNNLFKSMTINFQIHTLNNLSNQNQLQLDLNQ
jgi:hypothetical protein